MNVALSLAEGRTVSRIWKQSAMNMAIEHGSEAIASIVDLFFNCIIHNQTHAKHVDDDFLARFPLVSIGFSFTIFVDS
jgi:hypothetical protein